MQIYGKSDMISFALSQMEQCEETMTIVNQSTEEGRKYSSLLPLLTEQSYTLEKNDNGLLLYGDEAGCMYGLLDVASALKQQRPLPLGMHQPHMLRRGIKMNIPLDARTPSYSDAGDSAWLNIPHMWEMSFWEKQIDFLALNKYNFISLWSLNPFPSMVKADGFENVSIENVMRTEQPVTGASLIGYGMYTAKHAKSLTLVKRMSIDEKIAFWQQVMVYGAKRGIRFVIMIWNVYPCCALQSEYGITEELQNPITKAYYRASAKALVETYPLLYGIGVTAGERMGNFRDPHWDMKNDVRWISETYGEGIRDAVSGSDRDFRLIFRQHMCSAQDIIEVLAPLNIPVEFSYKYSVAHMYSAPVPTFGDAFFASLPKGATTWLTVRNDDMYMLRWGGIDFARAYLNGAKREHVCGFWMGPDGYTEGIDYLTSEKPWQGGHVFHRQWLRTAVWGQLAYDVNLSEDAFSGLVSMQTQLDQTMSAQLIKTTNALGDVLPLVTRMHWHNLDFMGYTETACGLDYDHDTTHIGRGIVYHDIFDFLQAEAQKGSGCLSVMDTCKRERIHQPVPDGMITADQVVDQIWDRVHMGQTALQTVVPQSDEAQGLYQDMQATILLGSYYATKIKCALTVRRVVDEMQGGDPHDAMHLAKSAYDYYAKYCDHMSARYVPQRLSRMHGFVVDMQELKKQAAVDKDRICLMMEAYLPLQKGE